jgi:N-acetylglucosaminyldiphosphoundecaprenol N-acetyl-beta-D-mannosaminyltransferase
VVGPPTPYSLSSTPHLNPEPDIDGSDAAAALRGPAVRKGLWFGHIWVDAVTAAEALTRIGELVEQKRGGAVYTPNVDHVVIAESNVPLRAAYERASLAVPDGAPLVWASWLLRHPLPERVAGSDLFLPLMERAAHKRWRVYLLGGAVGVAEEAAHRLRGALGVNVVGWHSPTIAIDGRDVSGDSVSLVRASRPDLVVVAFGNPKQELWIDNARHQLGPAVALGFGAVLDFLVGKQRRAPSWIARIGLEWFYRLMHEPRRLWRRYLVQDPRFVAIVARIWRHSRTARIDARQMYGRDPVLKRKHG